MAKPTLLSLVQDILSDSDGDEVNSISDTVESDQCARVIKDTFSNIVDIHDIKYHEQVKQLEATSSATPHVMTRPDGMHSIEWVKYDKKTAASGDPDYERVNYMEPERFIIMAASRSESDANVTAVALASGHEILIRTDQAPTYFTFLDGYDNLIFDSYDIAVDTNLQKSKSIAFGVVKPTLALTDAAIPDLPEHLFTLLRNESRAFYFDVYKDGTTKEVDERKRRSQVRAQRKKRITKNLASEQTGQNYGRKRR